MFKAWLICYLIGSIPLSVYISIQMCKQDIRSLGSCNIGTSNVYRNFGFAFALFVGVFDFLKGYIATKYIIPQSTQAMFFVCLGQMFPIWLLFKGGKGVGCFFGALSGLSLVFGGSVIASWMLIVNYLKAPFVATFIMLFFAIIAMYVKGIFDIFAMLTILVILIKHASNVYS